MSKTSLRRAVRWGAVAFLTHLLVASVFLLLSYAFENRMAGHLARRLHELTDFAVYSFANEAIYQLRHPLNALASFLGLGVKGFGAMVAVLYSGLVGGAVYFAAGFLLGFLWAGREARPAHGSLEEPTRVTTTQ